jgi:hypothetical protein
MAEVELGELGELVELVVGRVTGTMSAAGSLTRLTRLTRLTAAGVLDRMLGKYTRLFEDYMWRLTVIGSSSRGSVGGAGSAEKSDKCS